MSPSTHQFVSLIVHNAHYHSRCLTHNRLTYVTPSMSTDTHSHTAGRMWKVPILMLLMLSSGPCPSSCAATSNISFQPPIIAHTHTPSTTVLEIINWDQQHTISRDTCSVSTYIWNGADADQDAEWLWVDTRAVEEQLTVLPCFTKSVVASNVDGGWLQWMTHSAQKLAERIAFSSNYADWRSTTELHLQHLALVHCTRHQVWPAHGLHYSCGAAETIGTSYNEAGLAPTAQQRVVYAAIQSTMSYPRAVINESCPALTLFEQLTQLPRCAASNLDESVQDAGWLSGRLIPEGRAVLLRVLIRLVTISSGIGYVISALLWWSASDHRHVLVTLSNTCCD